MTTTADRAVRALISIDGQLNATPTVQQDSSRSAAPVG